MSVQNNSRATDLGDLLTEGTTGFTVRKTSGVGLFFHFFLLGCMVIMGVAMLVSYQSPKGCALAVAIGAAFAVIAHNLERNKKMKEALEFMNALFSSAMGKGYKFCCIVKNTGDIVFYNRPFQAIFPAYILQDTRTLKSLLNLYNLPEADRDTLTKMMAEKTEGTLATSIRAGAEKDSTPITFYLDTIERPTGFFMLRGK